MLSQLPSDEYERSESKRSEVCIVWYNHTLGGVMGQSVISSVGDIDERYNGIELVAASHSGC